MYYVVASWNSHSGIAAFSTSKEKLNHATSYHLDYLNAYLYNLHVFIMYPQVLLLMEEILHHLECKKALNMQG